MTAALSLSTAACGDDDPVQYDAGPQPPDASMTDGAVDLPDAMPDALALVVDPTSLTIDEGDDGTFTVALSRAPGGTFEVSLASDDIGAATVSPATLTFTDADFDTPQTVTVSAVDDDDADDESVTITVSGTDVDDVEVTVTVIDTDTQSIVASPLSLDVWENGQGTVSVRLSARPSATVTVDAASADTDVATVSPSSLTFDATDWDTGKTLTISGVSDGIAGDRDVDVTLSATGIDDDAVIEVTVLDVDALLIVATPLNLDVNEEAQATFAVTLSQEPPDDVVIDVSSANVNKATVSPATLTFTPANYSTAQQVTVTGVKDDDTVDDVVAVSLVDQAQGLPTRTVTVTVVDLDTQEILTDAANDEVTVAEGGQAQLQVALKHNPLGTVTLSFESSDPSRVTAPQDLTFDASNWMDEQTASISTTADADLANHTITLSMALDDADETELDLTVHYQNTTEQALVVNAPTPFTVEENQTSDPFTVRLAFPPLADVTVDLSTSPGGKATLSDDDLVFTTGNWNVPQGVTVTGVHDNDVVDDLVTITLDAGGSIEATLQITVIDIDTLEIVPAPAALSVNEGATGSFDVTLSHIPPGTVVVDATSLDTDRLTITSGTVLTFDSGNWDDAQTVALQAHADDDTVDDLVNVTLVDRDGSITTQTVAVTVVDLDQQAIVAASPVEVFEGSTASLEVRLAHDPLGPVTVELVSADPDRVTPSVGTLAFDAGDWNVNKSVTLTAHPDQDLENHDITLNLSVPADSDVPVLPVTVQYRNTSVQEIVAVAPATPFTVMEGATSAPFTVRLAFQPQSNVTVGLTTSPSDKAELSDGSLTFTPGNWDAPQGVTVDGLEDDDALDDLVTITMNAGGGLLTTLGVTVIDTDTQKIVVTPPATTINEDQTARFYVRLDANPVEDAVVTIMSTDTSAVTVNPPSLTFTADNWNPATPEDGLFFEVYGVPDDDLVDEIVDIVLSSTIASDAVVVVTVEEIDLQSLLVSETSMIVEKGDTGEFTVRLEWQPPGTVGVFVESSNTDAATISPSNLVFTTTNYATPQTVTAAGIRGTDLHDAASTVTVTSPGLLSKTVEVAIVENDQQRILVYHPGTDNLVSFLGMNEPDERTLEVRLQYEPVCDQGDPGCMENVSLDLASERPLTVEVSPPTLGFTSLSFDARQTVTLTADTDDDAEDEHVTLTLRSNEPTTDDHVVEITVTDKDAMNFQFHADSTTHLVEAGEPGEILVRLTNNPLGTLLVTATSLDTSKLLVGDGETEGEPFVLEFNADNWEEYQALVIRGIADIDLTDDTVIVRFTSPDIDEPADRPIVIADIDTQEVVVGGGPSITVVEGGTTAMMVSLAHKPDADRTVNVNLPGGETKIGVGPTSLVFTPDNFDVPQEVTVSGLEDDDLNDHQRSITLVTSNTTGNEAASLLVSVEVLDNDVQVVTVLTDPPAPFPLTVQEGGPTNRFEVVLDFRPRNDEDDTVDITTDNEDLELSLDGDEWLKQTSLTFTAANWDSPQVVHIRGLDDFDDPAQHEHVVITLGIEGDKWSDAAPAFLATTQDVTIIDDEISVLETAVYDNLHGGTRHTKRQNVQWAHTVAVVSGYDNSGNTVIASVPRDDLGDLQIGPTIASSAGVANPVEAVEFDGTNIGVFASDTSGIVYASSDTDFDVLVAPMLLGSAGEIDFWPSFDGIRFGLIWRDSLDGNLLFRTVDLDGETSNATIVTTPGASPHQHPNVHPRAGGGWSVLYTTATAVRCLRLDAAGFPISNSDVALAGVAAGAFVSSIYNQDENRIIAAYSDPTDGLSVARIRPSDCEVEETRAARPLPGGTILNTPFIAYNGVEYKIAFDQLSDATVGVATLGLDLLPLDEYTAGAGNRPSIAWAGDRWILRYASSDSITIETGSFQTHCSDGVHNEDELFVDCGGSCRPCTEFSFADRSTNDLYPEQLRDFFAALDLATTDYLFFEIVGTSSSGSWNPGAWCATRADWYAEQYLLQDGGSGNVESGEWDKWSRPSGEEEWEYTNESLTNSYGDSCASANDLEWGWCGERGIGGATLDLGIFPARASSETRAGTFTANFTGRSLTIRVGSDRASACGF